MTEIAFKFFNTIFNGLISIFLWTNYHLWHLNLLQKFVLLRFSTQQELSSHSTDHFCHLDLECIALRKHLGGTKLFLECYDMSLKWSLKKVQLALLMSMSDCALSWSFKRGAQLNETYIGNGELFKKKIFFPILIASSWDFKVWKSYIIISPQIVEFNVSWCRQIVDKCEKSIWNQLPFFFN